MTDRDNRTPLREPPETARYRGFTLAIPERGPVVILRDGRRLDEVPSVPAARRFIRGWIRAERSS